MREKRTFAERTKVLPSDEVRKKYFLIYEGEETELIYFDAVNALKDEIGINPLIELIPVVRSYSEHGWSNPKKILDRMIQNIEETKTGFISYETMLNWIMDYFREEDFVSNNRSQTVNMWKTLVWICEEKLNANLNMKVENLPDICKQIADIFADESGLASIVEDIPKIIKFGSLTYAEGLDQVCFIFDRDRKSFITSQYEYVLKQCRDKGFGFYVSNPCFEFWLLLHFEDVGVLDQAQLLENPKVISTRRYSEAELRRRIPGYKKSHFHAIPLVRNIDRAIKNEKEFCEDETLLENNVGSNIGLLICEMRKT